MFQKVLLFSSLCLVPFLGTVLAGDKGGDMIIIGGGGGGGGGGHGGGGGSRISKFFVIIFNLIFVIPIFLLV